MQLTKYTHATVSISSEGRTLLIDPGTFTPDAAILVADAEVVLLTHEHYDHFDQEAVLKGLADRPELHVYGPAPVARALEEFADRVHVVAAGDCFEAAGFHIAVYGDKHALIHPEMPRVDNIGYLIDGTVLHPGDAYLVPGVPVDTLLVPTSGPWTYMGEAINYIRAVRPRQSIQIHDVMLSPVGIASAEMFLGAESLTGTPLRTLPVGDTITV